MKTFHVSIIQHTSRLRRTAILIIGLSFASAINAATFDYNAEYGSRVLTVRTDLTTLAGFLQLCGEQTHLNFVYQPEQLPMEASITLPVGENQPLPRVLMSVSTQANVVFQRVNDQVAVRMRRNDDVLVPVGGKASVSQQTDEDSVVYLDELLVVAENYDDKQAMMQLRMADVKFTNMMSSEDFSRFSAGDMGEAITRVAGVNLASGRFAVIRGLSERYSGTLVNGVPVPSPDPQKQGVHLDMFSSDIVDRLIVSKSFSPDGPSNAAAGFVNIVTTKIPYEPFVSFSLGTRMNQNAADDFVTYGTMGNHQRWANGSKDRMTDVWVVSETTGKLTFSSLDPDFFYEGLDMVPQHDKAPLGVSFTAAASSGFELFKRSFRIMFSGSYDSDYVWTLFCARSFSRIVT